MIWSFSGSKTFERCQRQWYFKNCLANHRAKDPNRRQAYLLSKLTSISAWRGMIVDLVISKTIIPSVNKESRITLPQVKKKAEEIFEKQLKCAKEHSLHRPNFSPSKLGDKFAALHCMEYEGVIPENEIKQAKADIDKALTNLFAMKELCKRIKSGNYLISQRSLSFSHSDVSVRAVPDLIIFYQDKPPLIVDWKVHTFGVQQAYLQLGIYALALKRCKPHKDFPRYLSHWKETEMKLMEVQLLTNQIREHQLSQESLTQVENYIASSSYEMSLVIGNTAKKSDLEPIIFDVAKSPQVCQRCPYKSMCWEVA